MKEVQWTNHGAVGLDELPKKPLRRIGADKEMETGARRHTIAAAQQWHKDSEKGEHRDRLVQLHRMAQNAVPEIIPPRKAGRRPIGAVLDPGQKAAEPPDH